MLRRPGGLWEGLQRAAADTGPRQLQWARITGHVSDEGTQKEFSGREGASRRPLGVGQERAGGGELAREEDSEVSISRVDSQVQEE